MIAKHIQFVSTVSDKIASQTNRLSAIEGLKLVASDLGLGSVSTPTVLTKSEGFDKQTVLSKSGISREDIPMQLMYHMSDNQELRLVWDLSVLETENLNWWSIRIDTSTGQIVDKVNWTNSCRFEHTNVRNDKKSNHKHSSQCTHENQFHSATNSNAPDSYRVYPIGIESPNHGPRTLEVNPANAIASPFGWQIPMEL